MFAKRYIQKQSPGGVLQKKYSYKFAKFTGKHLCQSFSFNKVAGLRPKTCNFIKKETLSQVFTCQFCEISKNAFFHRAPYIGNSIFKNNLSCFTPQGSRHWKKWRIGISFFRQECFLYLFLKNKKPKTKN